MRGGVALAFAVATWAALSCRDSAAEPKAKGKAAAAGAPTTGEASATAVALAAATVKPRRLTADELAALVKALPPSKGRTTVPEQSFRTEEGGHVRLFAPMLEADPDAPTSRDRYYVQYEQEDAAPPRRVTADLTWAAGAVEAVAFDDVDKDGDADAIVLVKQLDPSPFRAARVLRRRADGHLELDWGLTDTANLGAAAKGLAEVRKRLQGPAAPALPAPAAVGPHDKNGWQYYFTGNVDDDHLRCHGRAAVRPVAAEGGARCVSWRLIDVHCVGKLAIDYTHVEGDGDKPTWLDPSGEHAATYNRVCKGVEGWGAKADPPGVGSCHPAVTGPAESPKRIEIPCEWRCREPSTCVGNAHYTFEL